MIKGRLHSSLRLKLLGTMLFAALVCATVFCVGEMLASDAFLNSRLPQRKDAYQSCILILAILCGVIFAAAILLYNRYIIKRIIRLSKQTREIERGQLQTVITTHGTDELSMLASDIASMRDSMIERVAKEQAAFKANSDLITSMSHDIRTPLTALIGYLDLVDAGQYSSDEQMKKYIGISRDKAIQLKVLTDELFRYALVFGNEEVKLDIGQYDATIILDQLIGEHIVEMQLGGWRFETQKLDLSCSIKADALYLKRVFDNLFSNIEKYADPSAPVAVIEEAAGDSVHVCISNTISESRCTAESTGIGLKTCGKIMEMLGGSMTVRRDEMHFAVELVLPTVF